MIKETVICVIIVILIFGLDVYTQNFTEKTVSEITEIFSSLKEAILDEDKEKINDKIESLTSNWQSKHDKFAYYIEHDELEKVDTAIVKMKSYIETDNFAEAITELEEGKFVIEHIQDKNAFNLQNIF